MPYRVSYRDATDADRLVAVADSLTDARLAIDEMNAALPQAARRLVATDDPLLGLELQVIQPPYTLDTAGGLPVVYLGGTVDACDNWQATATAALRPRPAIIVNPRRERPTRAEQDTEAAVRWRRLHLLLADIALYWFADGEPDSISMLELGTRVDSTARLVVGASPGCPRRQALIAHLRYLDPEVVYDTLPDTVAAVGKLVEDHDPGSLAMSRFLSEPAAVAWTLQHTIEADRYRELGDRLDEIVGEASRAAGVGFDPLLLMRIYVAVDRLRLDGGDPLGWAELHYAGRNWS